MSVTAVVEPVSCCGFSTLILIQCVIFTLPVICLVTGGFPRAKLVFRRVFPQRQGVAGRPSHGPVCTSMALAVRWIGLDRVRSGSMALVSVCACCSRSLLKSVPPLNESLTLLQPATRGGNSITRARKKKKKKKKKGGGGGG